MLVSGSYPNFIQGVSQQSYSVRLPTQGSLQTNGYSSPVDGLSKRPPTEWLAKLNLSLSSATPFVHFINRDESERYVVVIDSNGDPKVFDLEGNAKTVTTTGTYSHTTNPSRDLKALTMADTTFLVNRNTTVSMTADVTSGTLYDAVVWVRQGTYEASYTVAVNGTHYDYTVPASTDVGAAAAVKTSAIADELKTLIADDTSLTVERTGSVLHIKKTDGSSFNCSVGDSVGNSLMTLAFKSTDKFSNLPPIAVDGMVVLVKGDPASQADDYYVKFEKSGSDNFGSGLWVECTQVGIPYKLDAATMPHTLVRNSDGTFTFGPATWLDRGVGTVDSSPNPSFVGDTINDVFLFKNRLGFLSGPNVILSRSGNFFDFWRETMLSIPDDDPIDVTATHPRIINLYHAVSFNTDLLIFGDDTQMVLSGNETLTPKTVNITFASEYTSDAYCRPVAAGDVVLFPFSNGTYAGLREYLIDGTSQQKTARTVSSPVPKYISGRATGLSVSTTEDVMCLLADGDRTGLYVYKWLYNGNDKVQNSISQWTLGPQGTTVYGCQFIGPLLFLLVGRSDGVHLESLNLAPGHSDDYCTYITHLDQRVTESDCTVAYDANRDQTTYTLPYDKHGDTLVVTRATADSAWIPGVVKGLDVRNPERVLDVFIEDSSGDPNDAVAPKDNHVHLIGPLSILSPNHINASSAGFVTATYYSKELMATNDSEFWIYVNGNRLETQSITETTTGQITVPAVDPTELTLTGDDVDASGSPLSYPKDLTPSGGDWTDDGSPSTLHTYIIDGVLKLDSPVSGPRYALYEGGDPTGTWTFAGHYYDGPDGPGPYPNGTEGFTWPATIEASGNGSPEYTYGGVTTINTVSTPVTLTLGQTHTFRVNSGDLIQIYNHTLTGGGVSGLHDESTTRSTVTDITTLGLSDNQVKVTGDLRNKAVWIGHTYEFRYRITPPLMRSPSQLGGVDPVTIGRLQVHSLDIDYDTTGYFRVEVTPKSRGTSTSVFTAKRVGISDTLLGEVPLKTGTFKCGVLAQNTQVDIDLVNDSFLPSRFTGGNWEGNYTTKSRRF